jgi:hypothetical protein
MSSVVIAGDVSGTCTLQAANAAGTTVLTLPTTSGTLISTTTPLNASSITSGTLAVAYGGTGVGTSTGTGNVVLSTSPTLVTPVLGTPSSGNLASCTGYSASNLASGTLPAARLPAGSVLKVVSSTLTTLLTASADTWTTVTSASITPSSSSNKILIMFNMPVGAVGQETISRVLRGATVITEYSGGDITQIGWSFTGNGSAGWQGAMMSGSFLDSPSTTSSTTYNLQAYQQATTLYVNRTSGTTPTDSAGGVTTITLMEIAA